MNDRIHVTLKGHATVFIPTIGVSADFTELKSAVKFATHMTRIYVRDNDYTTQNAMLLYHDGKMMVSRDLWAMTYGKMTFFNDKGLEKETLEYWYKYYRYLFPWYDAKECLARARREFA